MKKILLSGFEPFGNLDTNPTTAIISRAEDWDIEGINLETLILPVVYNECASRLIEKIEVFKPDIVLSLGVAVGRSAITPERIGINIQDTAGEGKTGDNRGDQPRDRFINDGGPDGLFSTLPIRQIVELLESEGIPAQISNTAGTYICNNTLYSILYYINRENLDTRAGFIHVPASPDMVTKQPQMPSMAIDVQEKAIKHILEFLSKKD